MTVSRIWRTYNASEEKKSSYEGKHAQIVKRLIYVMHTNETESWISLAVSGFILKYYITFEYDRKSTSCCIVNSNIHVEMRVLTVFTMVM